MLMKPDVLDLDSLLRVPYIDPDLGFDLSPDGNAIAFAWNITGQWEIFVKIIHPETEPRQITSGAGAKFAPRWRPDGAQLAYVLDLDGGENYDIYSYCFRSDQHINLTPDTPEAIASSFGWSPDGKRIAYCSDRDGRFDTFIKQIANGQVRKVLDSSYPDWEVSWSPDGNHLAVVSEAKGQDYWTTIVDLVGGGYHRISIDGSPIYAKDANWSPDGMRVVFSSNLFGKHEIGIFDTQDKKINWMTAGEGEKERPEWISENLLAYVISQGPRCKLAIHHVGEQEGSWYEIEPGVIYSPKASLLGKHLYFIFDNPRHPCDLWSFHLESHKFDQVTFSLPQAIDPKRMLMPKEIQYPGLDGVNVPALRYSHEDDQPNVYLGEDLPPGILYVHGGPNWLAQFTWDPLVQHMASRGWVVLAPNYRGSTGYGRDWQLASRFDLGGVDTKDVAAGADYLVREGKANPRKIGVTGRSWGGYLTMTCLTQFPDKWAAGSAVVPFMNWFTSHANSREDLRHWDLENFGDPVTNRELWYERSPFFFMNNIQSPVQFICGANDVRCPASESEMAYKELIALGKVCEYSRYEDEGHSFLKIENQIKSKHEQVDFLAKILEISNQRIE